MRVVMMNQGKRREENGNRERPEGRGHEKEEGRQRRLGHSSMVEHRKTLNSILSTSKKFFSVNKLSHSLN